MVEGYKKTEIGEFPMDWSLSKMQDKSSIYRGGSPRPIASYITNDPNGINWIKIGDVAPFTKFIYKTEEKIKQSGAQFSKQVKEGDFLLSNSMSFGRPYILKTSGCIHDGWLTIQNYKETFDTDFLYYILGFETTIKQYKTLAAGSTVLNLNKEIVKSVNVCYPPNKAEQTAIATVLNDVDALIQQLELLLTKKQKIKTGVMQELLRPKEGWNIKKLGEILKVRHGKSQKEVASENGAYPILASGGIIGKAETFLYNKPSVLIGRKGTIDKPQYMDTPFWSVDTLFYTEIFEEYDPKFIYYLFNLIDWYSYNEASGVPSLNAKTIERIARYFPKTRTEQTNIAQIISDMDIEIQEFENQIDKYKMLKQGIMQSLLTGKIRLV